MTDDDASEGESLEEGTRRANSNLQRLIDAVGGLLTASADLLARLQRFPGGAQPAAATDSNGPDEPIPPRSVDRGD